MSAFQTLETWQVPSFHPAQTNTTTFAFSRHNIIFLGYGVEGWYVASLPVRTFHFSQWQRMNKVRVKRRDFDWIISTRSYFLLCRDNQLPYPLWHNRKMSLTWNLMSYFSSRYTSCCYKLFKQLLRNSTFAAFAKNLLWPWTWYAAIVTVISQVTRSIWCFYEPRLSTRFDSLPFAVVLTFEYHKVSEQSCGKAEGDEKFLMGTTYMKCWWVCERDVYRCPGSTHMKEISCFLVQPDMRWSWLG